MTPQILTRFPHAQHCVVMGVSGCGKSTLGGALAHAWGWQFIEGDAYHPAANIAKMVAGQPLNDNDRAPWLATLNQALQQTPYTVLACSALKPSYRALLNQNLRDVVYVYCHGSYEQLAPRMAARTAHFMPSSLLQSQLNTLVLPDELGDKVCTVSVLDHTDAQMQQIQQYFYL